MAENKTKATAADAEAFLNSIEDPARREDCKRISAIMEELSGAKAKMWGASIVGFGDYHYTYASGREGDWFLCGFSPRKQSISIYIMGYLENYTDILKDLGKFKNGKGCLYIKRLDDVDVKVLRILIGTSIKKLRQES